MGAISWLFALCDFFVHKFMAYFLSFNKTRNKVMELNGNNLLFKGRERISSSKKQNFVKEYS